MLSPRTLIAALLLAASPLFATGLPTSTTTPTDSSTSASPTPSTETSSVIIAGRVADSTQAVIPSAKVDLIGANGKVVASTTTTATGDFKLTGITPGSYELRVSYNGFESHVERIIVAEGVPVEAAVTMNAAGGNETVTVTATAIYAEPNAVSATKLDVATRDVPQSIAVVNGELMRSQAVSSMQDVVRNVPGVSVHLGEGRRDQVLIRGFSAINDQLVDGFRDDSPYYRDLANVERVEVLKGPAAVLYGRGSSGGVINRVTKSPVQGGKLAELTTNAGSYGEKRVAADFGSPLFSQKFAFRLTGAYENTGTFRHYSDLDRYSFTPSLLWKPSDVTTVTFSSDNLFDERTPDRGIPSVNGKPADVPYGEYYGDPQHDFMRNKVYGQTLRLERSKGAWIVRNNFRHAAYDNNYWNTQPTSSALQNGAIIVGREQYDVTAKQHNYFNQTEATRTVRFIGREHRLLVGAEYGYQTRDTLRYTGKAGSVSLLEPVLTSATRGATPATNNDFSGTTGGLFVQDLVTLGAGFKALVGGRFDYYRQSLDDHSSANADLSRIDRQFSPRAGLVYQPTSWMSLYGNFTRSFQPSGEGLSLAVNNAELKPETSTNYEVGSKFEFFGGRLGSTLSLFRLNRNNVKTTDPSNTSRLLSVGLQRTDGFEVSLSGRLAKHLDVFGGYAYLDAETVRSTSVSSGVPLQGKAAALVPKNSFNMWSTYTLANGFGFGGGVIYNDVRYAEANNLVALPAFTRVDATVFYRKQHYDIALNIKNLLNTNYYESAHTNYQIMPGAPINGLITTRLRW